MYSHTKLCSRPSGATLLRLRPSGATRPRPSGTRTAARRLAWLSLLSLSFSMLLATSIAAQDDKTAPPVPDITDGATFQVVVNADNPTTELPAAKVARMFLKKLRRWDHGTRTLPVDLGLKSPIRKDFTKSVHGKSVTAIKSYWQRMIFGRGEVPPDEMSSEEEILEIVRANPGAIGYVAAETPLGDGVKKLKVTP